MKEEFIHVSKKFGKEEFISLAKFILIAGIILPNLPDEPVFSLLQLYPYKLWLAIVAVSGISYLSYLYKKFIFPKSGVVVSGMLGGFYSSTAVSLILSRKSREGVAQQMSMLPELFSPHLSCSWEYFLIVMIFNPSCDTPVALSVYSLRGFRRVGFVLFLKKILRNFRLKISRSFKKSIRVSCRARIRRVLYNFSLLLQVTENRYRTSGLNFLSFIAGFADVDAYVMNIVQGKFSVSELTMVAFILKLPFPITWSKCFILSGWWRKEN